MLLHHPVLWWASAARDLAPLHVSVVDLGGTVALLAGPGGVGKSTLVSGALAHGAGGTSDNVAVTDGTTVWGLREPLRLDRSAATGPRAAHGRVEQSWPEWLPALRPTVVVVVRRRAAGAPGLREISGDEARRVLVAGTLAAGELMRFWPLCATLAEATGIGPALPRVESVAAALTDRLPCVELAIVDGAGSALHLLLSLRAEGAPAR